MKTANRTLRYLIHEMINMNTTRNRTFQNATSGLGILYQSDIPSPTGYAVMSAVLTIVLLLGLLENFAVLYTFARNKSIRTKDNMLIAGLAISDIGQSVFGVPFVLLATICQQWIFGNFMCQYYGFITTSFGLSQITLLTFIALERYFINIRHVRKFTYNKFKCRCVISFCFLYGFSWAAGPLFGWSSYKLEATGIACSVSWDDKTLSSITFTVSLFTFGWFLPLILIAFGYISIARLVLKERIRRKRLQNGSTHRRNWEKRVSITILMMIGAFILSWFPYSAISLWSALSDTHAIPVWLRVVPALFAKSSIIWNPIIYVCRNGNFRQAVFNSLSCFMLVKTQSANANGLAQTKITDSETSSIHKDIKTKLKRIKSGTTKALKKERIYNFKNKNITSKPKKSSKRSASIISQTRQDTTVSSRKSGTNTAEVFELDCNKTKSSPPIRRCDKFSAFRKRGLLEKIPENESEKFSNHVQRNSFKRTQMLSYIRNYDSSWRQSNKLAEKQTQTDELVSYLERTLTTEKGLQTDIANWNNVQTFTVKLTDETNGVDLSSEISLNDAVMKPCVSDLQKILKKRKFEKDSSHKNIIQTSYGTKRQYRRDLRQQQNGKSKTTTAVETMEPFGSKHRNGNSEFPRISLHPRKISKNGQERKKRYQSNVHELDSDVHKETIADFNLTGERVEIIHAWRDFDELQNEFDLSKVCQNVGESSHPEKKIKHFQTDTHISARAWRDSNDLDSNIPLLSDNSSDIICSNIF